jgi:hypothetical protein
MQPPKWYIHTTHALSRKGQQRHIRYSSETPAFYQNNLAMKNNADETGCKPIPVWSQYVSGVRSFVFYDIRGRKGEVLLFCPGHHMRRKKTSILKCSVSKLYPTQVATQGGLYRAITLSRRYRDVRARSCLYCDLQTFRKHLPLIKLWDHSI